MRYIFGLFFLMVIIGSFAFVWAQDDGNQSIDSNIVISQQDQNDTIMDGNQEVEISSEEQTTEEISDNETNEQEAEEESVESSESEETNEEYEILAHVKNIEQIKKEIIKKCKNAQCYVVCYFPGKDVKKVRWALKLNRYTLRRYCPGKKTIVAVPKSQLKPILPKPKRPIRNILDTRRKYIETKKEYITVKNNYQNALKRWRQIRKNKKHIRKALETEEGKERAKAFLEVTITRMINKLKVIETHLETHPDYPNKEEALEEVQSYISLLEDMKTEVESLEDANEIIEFGKDLRDLVKEINKKAKRYGVLILKYRVEGLMNRFDKIIGSVEHRYSIMKEKGKTTPELDTAYNNMISSYETAKEHFNSGIEHFNNALETNSEEELRLGHKEFREGHKNMIKTRNHFREFIQIMNQILRGEQNAE